MIIGIGVDIVDLSSFTGSFNKSKRFRQRVFTENEIFYCESKPNKYQHYAARFVVKEAVMKAIGTGWDKGVQWKQIETGNFGIVTPDTTDWKKEMEIGGGKPEIRLRGKALEQTKKMGVNKIFVSLSHSETQVIAFIIIEGNVGLETEK